MTRAVSGKLDDRRGANRARARGERERAVVRPRPGASETRKWTRPGTAAVPSAATTRDRDDAVAAAVTSFASGWMATRDTTRGAAPQPRRPGEKTPEPGTTRRARERGDRGTGLGASARAGGVRERARNGADRWGGRCGARGGVVGVAATRGGSCARASSATTSQRKRAPRQPLERRSRSLVSSLSSSGRRIARRAHRRAQRGGRGSSRVCRDGGLRYVSRVKPRASLPRPPPSPHRDGRIAPSRGRHRVPSEKRGRRRDASARLVSD